MSRRWLWTGLVLALVALVASRSVDIKWKEVPIDLGYSDAARLNPWLAAEQFHQKLGRPFQVRLGLDLLDSLPPVSDTVIITSNRLTMSARRREALLAWVAGGGHAIVRAHSLYNDDLGHSDDPLLDDLGIYLVPWEWDESSDDIGAQPELSAAPENSDRAGSCQAPSDYADDNPIEAGESPPVTTLGDLLGEMAPEPSLQCPDDVELTPVTLSSQSSLHAFLDGAGVLSWNQGAAQALAVDSYGAQIARVAYGDGHLTVMTDMNLWRNPNIGCYDNAFLLWSLGSSGATTWMLYREDMPSVWALLWRYFPLTCLAAGLLLLLWVLSQGLRSGLSAPAQAPPRRDFLEHLGAAADYQRRAEGGSVLTGLRQEAETVLARRITGFNGLSATERQQRVADLLKCPEVAVAEALYGQPRNDKQLLAAIQLLQRIRNGS